jgi:predicted lipoprotein with Yx(FWY)xxD motif
VIRRNRIAVAAIGFLAAVFGLAMWATNAVGVVQTNPAAQSGALQQNPAPVPGYGQAAPANPGQQPGGAADQGAAGDPAQQQPPQPPQPPQPAAPPAAGQPTLIAKSTKAMGNVVTDGAGRTLYRFEKDQAKPEPRSNCVGMCAQTWPPMLANGDQPPVVEGVDPAIVGTVTREDGTRQVTIGNWPVYTYAKDPGPGKWQGQGVMGTWFVVQPDGSRNVSCLPPGVTPPADKPAAPAQAPAGGQQGSY